MRGGRVDEPATAPNSPCRTSYRSRISTTPAECPGSDIFPTENGNLICQATSQGAAPGEPGYGRLGTLYTLDQYGNVTSQTADTGAVLSWTGSSYSALLNLSSFASVDVDLASSYSAVQDGNQSHNSNDIKENPFPRLERCSTSSNNTMCPGDYLLVALHALQSTIRQGCGACVLDIFSKIGSANDITSFSRFIGRSPGFFNGETSTLRFADTIGDLATIDEKTAYKQVQNLKVTVADIFANDKDLGALAVTMPVKSQSASSQQGLMIFLRPSYVCTDSATPNSSCQIFNQSTIFHEGLHNFYGLNDTTIQGKLGIRQLPCTKNISDYIGSKVYGIYFAQCAQQPEF